MDGKKVLPGPSTFGEMDVQPLNLLKEAEIEYTCNPYKRKLTRSELIEVMKPSCCLLNAAQGSLLDEPSLVKSLDSGKAHGARLDAFHLEPYTRGHSQITPSHLHHMQAPIPAKDACTWKWSPPIICCMDSHK